MGKFESLIGEYGESHKNETNILIHHFCVPLITLSVLTFFRGVSLGFISLADIVFILAILFYVRLKKSLFLPLLIFMGSLNILSYFLIKIPEIQYFNIALFIVSWVAQFIGHKIEGKKPSFLKDLQFLLIGPLWVLRKWGLVK